MKIVHEVDSKYEVQYRIRHSDKDIETHDIKLKYSRSRRTRVHDNVINIYSVSQKKSPLGFSENFSQTVGNF